MEMSCLSVTSRRSDRLEKWRSKQFTPFKERHHIIQSDYDEVLHMEADQSLLLLTNSPTQAHTLMHKIPKPSLVYLICSRLDYGIISPFDVELEFKKKKDGKQSL